MASGTLSEVKFQDLDDYNSNIKAEISLLADSNTEIHSEIASLSARPAPSRSRRPRACKLFAQGSCSRGDACTFSHDDEIDSDFSAPPPVRCPRCGSEITSGTCFSCRPDTRSDDFSDPADDDLTSVLSGQF